MGLRILDWGGDDRQHYANVLRIDVKTPMIASHVQQCYQKQTHDFLFFCVHQDCRCKETNPTSPVLKLWCFASSAYVAHVGGMLRGARLREVCFAEIYSAGGRSRKQFQHDKETFSGEWRGDNFVSTSRQTKLPYTQPPQQANALERDGCRIAITDSANKNASFQTYEAIPLVAYPPSSKRCQPRATSPPPLPPPTGHQLLPVWCEGIVGTAQTSRLHISILAVILFGPVKAQFKRIFGCLE
ncbi:hypothetical protein BaRGS_00024213 [Batillaria attramentaria]|uniref:Uncharacterized protein n=1 Tax=Batillaria attramentaria TaxID=370345 RepID=A0ABD0KC90_9CAEN